MKPHRTLGSIVISLLGQPTEFHVLRDDYSFPFVGILGSPFFRQHRAMIDYKDKTLHCGTLRIPFSKNDTILVKPRTVTPYHVRITNPERNSGYIPLMQPVDGAFLGQAIVTNDNGVAYLRLFNTTEQEFFMDIPHVELQDFEFLDVQEVGNYGSPTDGTISFQPHFDSPTQEISSYGRGTLGKGIKDNSMNGNKNLFTQTDFLTTDRLEPVSNIKTIFTLGQNIVSDPLQISKDPSRSESILRQLRLEHLNTEERCNIEELIKKHSDRFYLTGENLGVTKNTNHKIHTRNSIPIHVKQYRFPPSTRTRLRGRLRNC